MDNTRTGSPWLTTVDNPWNPFTQFDSWFAYDLSNEHCSNQVLAKFALTSDLLSEEENRQEVERAIDQIISIDPECKFVKVYADSFDDDIALAKSKYEEALSKVS